MTTDNISGFLLLNKPSGISSNHLLQQVRRALGKVKAGHCGTLDPIATGMLPICLGEATKFSSQLLTDYKTYTTTIRLGVATYTADLEGNISKICDKACSETQLKEVLTKYRDKIQQKPHKVSSIKHKGKRLYHWYREGVDIQVQPREITIHNLTLQSWQYDRFTLKIVCSKGTYVRSLAEDIGTDLGTCSLVEKLHRDQVGDLPIAKMVTLQQLRDDPQQVLANNLLPIDLALKEYTQLSLNDDEVDKLRQGSKIHRTFTQDIGKIVRLSHPKLGFIGLGEVHANSEIRPKRMLRTN